MITMGSDFQYESAREWFDQLDELIAAVTADGRVNIQYSTPSKYVEAKNAEGNLAFTVKTDDFFPYADYDHAYWTGQKTNKRQQQKNTQKNKKEQQQKEMRQRSTRSVFFSIIPFFVFFCVALYLFFFLLCVCVCVCVFFCRLFRFPSCVEALRSY